MSSKQEKIVQSLKCDSKKLSTFKLKIGNVYMALLNSEFYPVVISELTKISNSYNMNLNPVHWEFKNDSPWRTPNTECPASNFWILITRQGENNKVSGHYIAYPREEICDSDNASLYFRIMEKVRLVEEDSIYEKCFEADSVLLQTDKNLNFRNRMTKNKFNTLRHRKKNKTSEKRKSNIKMGKVPKKKTEKHTCLKFDNLEKLDVQNSEIKSKEEESIELYYYDYFYSDDDDCDNKYYEYRQNYSSEDDYPPHYKSRISDEDVYISIYQRYPELNRYNSYEDDYQKCYNSDEYDWFR